MMDAKLKIAMMALRKITKVPRAEFDMTTVAKIAQTAFFDIDAIAPPVDAGSVDRPKLYDMTLADMETRDWYFDCDGHYIDVELRKDGHYSIYFRNRADGGKGWLDTGVLIERSEKAEARAITAEDRLASANSMLTGINAELKNAEARVKELEEAVKKAGFMFPSEFGAIGPYDLKA